MINNANMTSDISTPLGPGSNTGAVTPPEGESQRSRGGRGRRRAARTTQILALAMRQVETRGLDGLTLQEIARDLDYSVPALYRYFPSKAALVAELQRRVVALLDMKLAQVEARTGEWLAELRPEAASQWGPLAPIAAAGLFYAGLARSAPQAFGLLAASLGDPRHLIEDDQARAVVATALPIFDRLAQSIDAAVEAGHLEPGEPMDRILVLWSSLHGVAQVGKLERLAPDRLDVQNLCRSLLEVLLIGWGSEPERVATLLDALLTAGFTRVNVTADDLIDVPASVEAL